MAILKGTGDVTDPPRPVAMTTSGQAAIACHIILCVHVCVCEHLNHMKTTRLEINIRLLRPFMSHMCISKQLRNK